MNRFSRYCKISFQRVASFDWFAMVYCLFLLQFDNLKRVFRQVEELGGHVVDNIKKNFLISDQLAKYVVPNES